MYHFLPITNASAYRRTVARRPAFSAPASAPTPLALDAARLAEGAELGDCAICGLTYHPDCASCAGAAA